MVQNIQAEVPSLDQVPVVREFLDVFQIALPGMPLDRDIKFCVDLIPNIQPISTPPYRMALVELWELKEQL